MPFIHALMLHPFALHPMLAISCRPSCAGHLVPAILCRPSRAGHPVPTISCWPSHAAHTCRDATFIPGDTPSAHPSPFSIPYTTNPSTYYTIYITIAYVYCRPTHMDWCQRSLGPPICTHVLPLILVPTTGKCPLAHPSTLCNLYNTTPTNLTLPILWTPGPSICIGYNSQYGPPMCNGYIIFHGPTMGWPIWQVILSLRLDRLTWT